MSIAVLPHKSTLKTAIKFDYPIYKDGDEPDILIHWGSTASTDIFDNLNSPDSIYNTSNKAKAISVLKEAGVPTLEFTVLTPCIGRTGKHTRGKGFWMCQNQHQMDEAICSGAEYFVKVYPKTREYRVHVAHGMVLFVQEKIGDTVFNLIWNKKNGFNFRVVPRSEWRKEVVEPAIRAVEALSLDFGAVDVMTDPKTNYFSFFMPKAYPVAVVAEVNTAPALEGYSLEKYKQYFEDMNEIGFVPVAKCLHKEYASSYRYKKSRLM